MYQGNDFEIKKKRMKNGKYMVQKILGKNNWFLSKGIILTIYRYYLK